jgi:hypothetical protein
MNAPTGIFLTAAGSKIKVGLPGQADILGFILWRGLPISFACECKDGTGRLSPVQIQWRDAWIRRGGLYILCRDPARAVPDLLDQLDKKINSTFFQDGK